eukprot:1180577-Prorocentrum_minimum.AAC.3
MDQVGSRRSGVCTSSLQFLVFAETWFDKGPDWYSCNSGDSELFWENITHLCLCGNKHKQTNTEGSGLRCAYSMVTRGVFEPTCCISQRSCAVAEPMKLQRLRSHEPTAKPTISHWNYTGHRSLLKDGQGTGRNSS